MSRPFRARHFLAPSPGRCPGLVYRAPSGRRGVFFDGRLLRPISGSQFRG